MAIRAGRQLVVAVAVWLSACGHSFGSSSSGSTGGAATSSSASSTGGANSGTSAGGSSSGSASCAWVAASGGQLTVLATAQAAPDAIAVDAQNVYWIDQGNRSDCGPACFKPGLVMEVPISGGTPTTLASGALNWGLAVEANGVYWATSFGGSDPRAAALMSVPIGGGTPSTLATTDAGVGYVAVDDAAVYWSTPGALLELPLGGGAATTLCSTCLGPLAADATGLYWLTADSVQSMPGDGGIATLFTQTYLGNDIALDATNVYFFATGPSYAPAAVMKVPIAGGSATTLAGGRPQPYGLAVDATDIYWTEQDGLNTCTSARVLRVPIAGGSVATLAWGPTASEPGEAMAVAVDATSIYWTFSSGPWNAETESSVDGGILELTPK